MRCLLYHDILLAVKTTNACDGLCVVLKEGSCLCNTAVSRNCVFGVSPKSIPEAMSNLYVWVIDPSVYDDGIYSSLVDIDTNIILYLKKGKVNFDSIDGNAGDFYWICTCIFYIFFAFIFTFQILTE